VRPARALELCAQVCEGLAASHRAGVLHLDLKPANVALRRLSDGTEHAVLLDPVTTHLLAHAGLRETAPLPIASAAYTSPEQARGAATDERSDLYGIGVLLFQLVSGRLPVTGATAEDLLRAHREHATLSLREIGRRVHPELEDLISRLMAADPAARPESGDESAVMMRALAALADAVPVADRAEESDPPPALAPHSRAPALPPRMLPPAVDPGLERAMMGHVASAPAEHASGLPRWAAFLPRRWRLAVAAAVVATVAAALLMVRADAKIAPPPLHGASLSATPLPDVAADLPAPSPPSKVAQYAASPWAKNFERAQKALWTNRAAGAETILRDILKKPELTRRDRARASRMMGEAEAKKGNRARAVQWWRQSFQLYDDAEERAKVARLMQALSVLHP
jgi:Protein kinase domain